jgi:hypothetical protein
MGSAGLVGGLSVPQGWASAAPTIKMAAATVPQSSSAGAVAPAIRTAAAMVPQSIPPAAPAALAADGHASLPGNIALSGLAGGAMVGTGCAPARPSGAGNSATGEESAVTSNIFFLAPEAEK